MRFRMEGLTASGEESVIMAACWALWIAVSSESPVEIRESKTPVKVSLYVLVFSGS